MRERELRLATGLVLAVFVARHILSHALGIVSMEWLEVGRRVQALVWQNALGTVALYAALLTHLALKAAHLSAVLESLLARPRAC